MRTSQGKQESHESVTLISPKYGEKKSEVEEET
jgi:hypothetical protein